MLVCAAELPLHWCITMGKEKPSLTRLTRVQKVNCRSKGPFPADVPKDDESTALT